MVYIVVVIFTVIIFPIFINVGSIFIAEDKKVYFNIRLFCLIPILSGYIERKNTKLFIHVSKNKALMVNLIDFTNIKKGVKPFFDYHFITQYSRIEIGNETNFLTPLSAGFLSSFIINIMRWVVINKKPYLKIDNNIFVYEEESKFNIFFKSTLVLNLLMIILSLIKIGIGKIYAK